MEISSGTVTFHMEHPFPQQLLTAMFPAEHRVERMKEMKDSLRRFQGAEKVSGNNG